MTWESAEKHAKRGPVVAILMGIALLVGVGGLLGVIGFCANPLRQAGRIVSKTIDADNVIYNYEWFKQRNQDIKALDAKIGGADATVDDFKAEAGPRSGWHREDREEASRLSMVALGLRQQRSDMAAEYNARSTMANRAIFQTGELPASILIDK